MARLVWLDSGAYDETSTRLVWQNDGAYDETASSDATTNLNPIGGTGVAAPFTPLTIAGVLVSVVGLGFAAPFIPASAVTNPQSAVSVIVG